MIKFERRNPFPLLNDGSYSKSEAQIHASEADRWLGLRVEETEARLARAGSRTSTPDASGEHQQLWFGLAPQDLQTPYLEIRSTLSALDLKGQKQIVDLGAAYGRMGFVIERHFENLTFTGFEYVGERVKEAEQAFERLGATRVRLVHADLTASSFRLPEADVYFIYDYGTPKAIEKTLYDIRRRALDREILIVARGRASRYSIESRHADWLTKSHPLAPERAITIYRSTLHLGHNLQHAAL